jgi:hypothetical protein
VKRRGRQIYRVPKRVEEPLSQFPSSTRLRVSDLERLAKLATIFGLFLYVVGLLSVNGYLLGFGITDFDLVRTRFIYTGFL